MEEPGDMPLMPLIHPPAINLVEMSTRQVLITHVSVSLLFEFKMK